MGILKILLGIAAIVFLYITAITIQINIFDKDEEREKWKKTLLHSMK